MIDLVYQVLFKIAYRLAKCYWFVRRPTTRGAYVAVWLENRILVIRNSYKRTFSLPAGGVDKGESYRSAATRELREETSIDVSEDTLEFFGEFESLEEYKRDVSQVFELRLSTEPDVKIDNREVVFAQFCSTTEAKEMGLTDIAKQYLFAASDAEVGFQQPVSSATSQ